MIRRFTAVFAWMLVMLSPMAVAAENEASRASAGQLAEMLRDYESYQADFIQIVVDDSGSQVQETRGELKASRPGRFYWETGAPLKQFIVSNGDTVEVYDPDLEQVTIHQLDDQVQSTPALLLSGEVDNLHETYEVYQRGVGSQVREFRLVPRSADSLFTSLRLSFSDGVLQEMRMEDSLGQLSILSFENVTLNEAIDNDVFRLDYPEGVDVIRDNP
ncbi:outer membrane lipoprotein carrier protein [Marinobacter persicus]|uniref:Outer-membrane lipoprotein carrier protein n=1 Tax=Marinobacter persicus TaxID=930118 RepID=A0A1I3TXT8_9GAMM|nr:outer-membrane lipoprotein carrier protein [Marinobacter persicus]SFJ75283.1 outer membrane lipoprotein carrier protein [Marinobacter persicus]